MSSCFLCDTSYKFVIDADQYFVVYAPGEQEGYYMKYMPIMIGSSGFEIDRQGDIVDCGTDQQHTNDKTQNYVSYRVKKIEFRFSIIGDNVRNESAVPDYVILFKVPFREPVFDYHFTLLKEFILFSEPESILSYCLVPGEREFLGNKRQRFPFNFCLYVNKPFIVGPNDYVGVLYFFSNGVKIESSAKVWFDVV